MGRVLAGVLLTVGLTTLVALPINGKVPTFDHAEVGPTLAFIAGLVATLVGTWLVLLVGRSARIDRARLAQLAVFQMEAKELFDRAVRTPTDDEAELVHAEASVWERGVRTWLRTNMPVYESVFISNTRQATITYGSTVSDKANLLANWAQERQHRLGEIIHTVARTDVN